MNPVSEKLFTLTDRVFQLEKRVKQLKLIKFFGELGDVPPFDRFDPDDATEPPFEPADPDAPVVWGVRKNDEDEELWAPIELPVGGAGTLVTSEFAKSSAGWFSTLDHGPNEIFDGATDGLWLVTASNAHAGFNPSATTPLYRWIQIYTDDIYPLAHNITWVDPTLSSGSGQWAGVSCSAIVQNADQGVYVESAWDEAGGMGAGLILVQAWRLA